MKTRALVASAALLALPLLGTTPARAQDDTVQVTSPRCGTIVVTTRTSGTIHSAWVAVDNSTGGHFVDFGTTTTTWTNKPSGRYAWRLSGSTFWGGGFVNVAPCSPTWPRRLPPGDETGDGRADVLAVDTAGNLRFYPSQGTRLAPGTIVGTGWGNVIHLERVKQLGGPGTSNVLLALRNDGTLWQYPTGAAGKVGPGKQLASGLGGYTSYFMPPRHNDWAFERPTLWANPRNGYGLVPLGQFKGGVFTRQGDMASVDRMGSDVLTSPRAVALYAFKPDTTMGQLMFTEDGRVWSCWLRGYDSHPDTALPCAAEPVGHGWNSMQLVRSPGSVDGDLYSDLVARRSDGDLYLYRTVNGTIQPGTVIGHNWNGIRLLA